MLVGLLLSLLCAMGFARGSQMDEAEVLEQASFIPALEEYYSKPTVVTTAGYEGDKDLWRVVLMEQTSGKEVARFKVADDSGEVSGVEVSPRADEIKYPSLSEDRAIKLAAASPEVREEFARHGPHNAEAKYEEGAWTVRFYVDERGAVGGRPSGWTTRPGSWTTFTQGIKWGGTWPAACAAPTASRPTTGGSGYHWC
jgi:hypothetical protein